MADIADADLPVFPFKVNWKDGIAERLEWKTDILADTAGNEQRRGLRVHPRRDFEVTITVWEQERSFLDLWLHRMIGTECLFPLWHDSVRATQAAAQGQKAVWVDTSGLEFTEGSYALLRGFSAMQFERILIAGVYSDRLVAVDDLVSDWPQGTRVEPLVRGWMSEQTRTRLASSRASETQAEFQTTRAQLYSEGVDSADQYLGLPVLNQAPNRSDALDVQHIWDFKETDSQTGRRYRKSEEGRADTSQKHSWFLRGRSAKSAFRSLLYRLKGSLGAVWVPTFNDDLALAQDSAPGAMSIYVKEIGFAYTGGPTSGREYIAIQTNSGWLYRRVTGTAVAPSGQERLVLDSPLPEGLTRASVRRISWMDTARLENDRIEFKHVNAADGMSTVSSIFRSFRNDRVAPEITSVPIPEDTKRPWPCDGRPEEPFAGWEYMAILSLPTNSDEVGPGSMICDIFDAADSSYGFVDFYYGTDGNYNPALSSQQAHVSADNRTVTMYWAREPHQGPPVRLFLQMQRLGGSASSGARQNSIQGRSWVDPDFTQLVTQIGSWGGAGNTGFPGAGNFPEVWYFGVS